ncbi:helix-turn-helix domain-containing protein [Sphaerimonospora sp. CA-214678]|uniref:helix-turn-helix domain-containing protein n=1 Tax=Sphaerimonospora sp. CA-214678 TaxID=3240029 RepID=UPI003D8ED4EA
MRLRRLAAELRRLRVAAGLSQDDVERQTHINVATLYRIETAKAKPQVRTLKALLDLYGVTDVQRADLMTLQKEAGKRGWLQEQDAELPGQYPTYISFEAEARQICNYESLFVPGLLQTEAYARAVVRGVRPTASEEDVEIRVAARLQRQKLLADEHRPGFWAILDEGVLARMVGGPDVMREQIARLAEHARDPFVTVQVVPFAAGAHPGMPGSFVVMKFGSDDPDIVYVDSMAGDLFLEQEAELTRYNSIFEHLRAVALSPGDTTAMLKKLAAS